MLTWDEFLAQADGTPDKAIEDAVQKLDPEGVATLIYTSGTTGPMMAMKTLLGPSLGLVSLRSDSPSAFSYCGTNVLDGPITAGCAATSPSRSDNVKEVRLFFGVPRIWEKFYAGVNNKLADATGVKKLVTWAQSVGQRAIEVKNRGQVPRGWSRHPRAGSISKNQFC